MFFGYKTQIHKNKYFINLGCSHAASFEMPIKDSYPYLLANKLGLGYRDYAYSRTSLEYSEYALSTSNYDNAEFVLWQLTYPWRKHNWDALNRQDARLDNYENISLPQSFKIYADLLQKYNTKDIYFFFVDQTYVNKYIKKLCSLNKKLYPQNIDFIDFGTDNFHGGPQSQLMIANKLYEFIKYDKTN